ncbi:MAG: glycosyltransferase family 1 protein [Termitinemataceae bacterium]|nr:MAG: glycosyltransferase family 1 protein [Termitinemataceae bacterium]
MKIGIDTFSCNAGISGVGVYLKQILQHIPSSGNVYELFGWEYDRFAFSETAEKGLEYVPCCNVNGKTANSLWHIFEYPKFAKKRGFDTCFFPAAHRRLPKKSPCFSVGTVHDMAAYWGTRRTRVHLGAVLRVVMPDSLRRLDKVIAVSDWVKSELIDLAKLKADRIEVIPNGVDTTLFYPRSRKDDNILMITPFSFKRPYILYAARLEYPVKNHHGLIRAFEIFKARTKMPHKLVLAGSNSLGSERIKAIAASSVCKNDIFFTGAFPSDSLPELFSAADMVVIPSFYEGFGQGAIEAMACGVPVACARAASLPETAWHAALYFDPYDPEDMADRMVSLASDVELQKRCRLEGIERAKLFSWDKCCARTLEILSTGQLS